MVAQLLQSSYFGNPLKFVFAIFQVAANCLHFLSFPKPENTCIFLVHIFSFGQVKVNKIASNEGTFGETGTRWVPYAEVEIVVRASFELWLVHKCRCVAGDVCSSNSETR